MPAKTSPPQPLAKALREIKFPPSAKTTAKKGLVDLEWSREQAIAKLVDAHRYIAVLASFVALHNEEAGAEIRAIAAVLA